MWFKQYTCENLKQLHKYLTEESRKNSYTYRRLFLYIFRFKHAIQKIPYLYESSKFKDADIYAIRYEACQIIKISSSTTCFVCYRFYHLVSETSSNKLCQKCSIFNQWGNQIRYWIQHSDSNSRTVSSIRSGFSIQTRVANVELQVPCFLYCVLILCVLTSQTLRT